MIHQGSYLTENKNILLELQDSLHVPWHFTFTFTFPTNSFTF